MYSLTYSLSSETVKDFQAGFLYIGAMNMKARILMAREAAGLTQEQLAKAVGKTRSAVAQWESGEIRPRHSTIIRIASATGKSIAWLESGIDESHIGLFCIGEVAAGAWRESAAMLKPYALPVTPHPNYPPDTQRLYKVSGNSVNRTARDGEYIHCIDIHASGESPVPGDLVVVRRMEHDKAEYTVKRFVKVGKQVILQHESDDPDFQEDIIPDGDDATEIEITDIVIAKWSPISRGSR